MLKLSAAAIAVFTVLSISQPAAADTLLSNNSVVSDANGNVVRAMGNGTCVRTKWVEGENACAPAPRVRTHTQTVLTDDERVVYFEFDKSDLTPAAQRNLISVAQRLAKSDDVASAEIVGYADRIGSNDYNNRLSARRAQTVKDFLVKNGYLNVNVAQVRAMGESRPVTNCPANTNLNNQIACLSPDRRVEIELTYVDRMRVTSVERPADRTTR